jgi:hypothetical protein
MMNMAFAERPATTVDQINIDADFSLEKRNTAAPHYFDTLKDRLKPARHRKGKARTAVKGAV